MSARAEEIRANLADVERRIAAACARAGRSRSSVRLVAVTKTFPAQDVDFAVAAGATDVGENRVQEARDKKPGVRGSVRWHLIGHLQRNKIERTLPLVHRIHAVDSPRLLAALDAAGRPVEAFLEVNCSGEAAKQGFAPDHVPALASTIQALRSVRIVGLMTMAAFEEDPERCRPTFALLRRLRDDLRRRVGDGHPLTELSMGMSNDFEVAVEEGATAVRIGTVLFAGLPAEEGP